jgi:hypothetical protein
MSWLFSLALVEGCSPGIFSDGGPSAPSSTTARPRAFSWHGRTTGASSRSPSGTTCEPLTDAHGEAVLTSYLAGFPAKPTPARLPERTLRTISGRNSGASWQMSLPGSYLPRTSSDARSTERRTTARRWVTPSSAFRLPRRTWVLTTFGPDIGYLHTPTVTANYCAPSMQKHACARAFRRVFGRVSRPAHEWLMGWPMGWTAREPLATGKFQEWRRLHSSPCSRRQSQDSERELDDRAAAA